MKPLASLRLAVAVVLGACHSVTEPSRPALLAANLVGAPPITLTVLGTLGPGPGFCLFPSSEPLDINERGLVVGWSDSACIVRGFMWENGTMTSLGTFGPVAVNNHDQIVGDRIDPSVPFPFGPTRGFLLDHGTMTDLGTLGGQVSQVAGVNDRGQIVGQSSTATGASHAFLWQGGTMTDLGTLGGNMSEAVAVNARGQVVGNSATATGAAHAFLWQGGTMTDLGTLGGDVAQVSAVNDRGQVVGMSTTATGEARAFLWRDGAMTDLGTLGGRSSNAHAVNKRGQIAGLSDTPSGETHVFLWQDGTMSDLGRPGPPQWSFSGALKMNDRGQIVGTLRFAAGLRGGNCFLWQAGTITQLPGQPGVTVALNDHNQIVGWSYYFSDPFRHAVLWTVGEPDDQNEQVAEGPGDLSDSKVGGS